MHLTASGWVPPLQQPKLVCHLGSSKHWDAVQAAASPSISKLHLLSFRRLLGCWLHHTLQDRGSATCYQDIVPVVFHNRLVMLAVFGIFFWVRTCYFHLHVASWGPHPTLAFTHSRVGLAPHSLAHPLPCRVCCCHPYFITHFWGVLLSPSLLYSLLLRYVTATLLVCTLWAVLPPPPFYARVHPTTCSPIYCQTVCSRC